MAIMQPRNLLVAPPPGCFDETATTCAFDGYRATKKFSDFPSCSYTTSFTDNEKASEIESRAWKEPTVLNEVVGLRPPPGLSLPDDEQCNPFSYGLSLPVPMTSYGRMESKLTDLPANLEIVNRLEPDLLSRIEQELCVRDSRQIQAEPKRDHMCCRWHESVRAVGTISNDGRVFSKTAGTSKTKMVKTKNGTLVELSTICMIYEATLRVGGLHTFNYHILDGEVGKADSAGFVFDTRVRRNNIQKMQSIFINQRGDLSMRDGGTVTKLGVRFPPLVAGMCITLHVDLDSLVLRFAIRGADGVLCGEAQVSLDNFFEQIDLVSWPRSGFFCAVVTKDISVQLT